MDQKKEENSQSWFIITVLYGRKYNKTWLLNSIQRHCSVRFTAIDFHYVRMHAQFFVRNSSTATALKDINYKILDNENRRISIIVKPYFACNYGQIMLTLEQIEQLKLTTKKRYDIFKKALDLQKFRFDSDLVDHDIDMILNRKSCMAAILKIIEENFSELLSLNLRDNKLYQLNGLSDIIQKAPNVKILNLSRNELFSTFELEKIKELNLEELWLKGNPLCDTFFNWSTYVSAIRDIFPKLLYLDGKALSPPPAPPAPPAPPVPPKPPAPPVPPAPVSAEMVISEIMNPYKETYKGTEALKNFILQFLREYYWIYDYGDRKGLMGAYHDEACFSLTTPFNPEEPAPSSLSKYHEISRNRKKHKDPILLAQLLKRTKQDIGNYFTMLPKTQHDFNSFVVDLFVQTVSTYLIPEAVPEIGLEEMSQAGVCAFTRVFIVVPASNSCMCIVNDQLFVRETGPKEIQGAVTTVPAAFSSSVATVPQNQQEMVQAFAIESGMYLQWSWKCLDDNNWDYTKAKQIFWALKMEGKIPEEAFQQNS
ncbi:nuclear RNA export factor 2 [Echinops telfairi]|uniref:Nuclear RNA export factor 2 n=1 Tax=Echinops telfairi TaxID=9371 RepID=A0AC55D436_ECHTE|nr:nuclear RNA export factor 2 [Echinops telfairi]